MKEKILVIVESPTKAKTIGRFLPSDYQIVASYGHVRDLPQKAADIPKNMKEEKWTRLGIDVKEDFRPLYVIPSDKKKVVRDLKKKVKEADQLILATDEDREGESISWHIIDIIKPEIPVKRMVFHEITKEAISKALENFRELDMDLVNAQETRRILDRLYGYTLSPLIWKKIAYGLSAGRVQSPGLRLIVERERERMLFKKALYFDLKALLEAEKDDQFEAKIKSYGDKKIAEGKDFEQESGKLKNPDNVLCLSEEEAEKLRLDLNNGEWIVKSLTSKDSTQHPAAPFITSTLQQEANRKLNMTARQTMRTAQALYERGLITYMRTDSPSLSAEGMQAARDSVEGLFGKDYLSQEPRQYKAKSRSAQEAHEAIRPAGRQFVHPDKSALEGREKQLYQMIWKRTLASQMAVAEKTSTTALIHCKEAVFQASGTVIRFPGFLKVYFGDNPPKSKDSKENFLPELKEGQKLSLQQLDIQEHETKPPARFTEASLVQRLEKEGIGRPSTYASIIGTLIERHYIRREGTTLIPAFTGFAVIQLLEHHFEKLINYNFTSEMEDSLDKIAAGDIEKVKYLSEFYLGKKGLKEWVEKTEKGIEAEKARSIELPQLKDVQIKVGKFGPYLVSEETTEDGQQSLNASIPEQYSPGDIRQPDINSIIELRRKANAPIGSHPETGESIYCLTGRNGPYLQLGKISEDNKKPRRASLPPGLKREDISIEMAAKLLSLPRVLGIHPDKGKEISVAVGRFGPFVVCDGDFRSLSKTDDPYTIKLDRALEIFAQPKKGRGGTLLLKELGNDPESGKKLSLYKGKYGPFLKLGTKNLPLPKKIKEDEKALAELNLESALELINQKNPKKVSKKKKSTAKK